MNFLGSLSIMSLLLLSATAIASPPTIQNPAEPPTVETWGLREVWRLENEEDDTLPLMGVINQAVVDEDGHVLLLDSQLAHVLEISEDGEFIGTLSRMGQGPGELERPYTLFLTDDGRLGLVQAFPGKIIFLNRDNTPAGRISAGGQNPMFYWVKETEGNMVIRAQTMEMTPDSDDWATHHVLGRYSEEGELLTAYMESSIVSKNDPPEMKEKGTWFPNRAWDQAADGSVLVATDRDRYRIEWLEPDGQIMRIITREFEPHVRTKEEKEKVLRSMRMWGPNGELKPKKTILDTEPTIKQIQVTADGRIWVRSCFAELGLPEDVYCRYDVFDGEGHLEKEVRIEFPINRKTDDFALLKDGRFLWFRNARSALDAVYANIEGGNKDEAEDDIPLDEMGIQVVLLERDN